VEWAVGQKCNEGAIAEFASDFDSGKSVVSDYCGADPPAHSEISAPLRECFGGFREGEGEHGETEFGHYGTAEFKETEMAGDQDTAFS